MDTGPASIATINPTGSVPVKKAKSPAEEVRIEKEQEVRGTRKNRDDWGHITSCKLPLRMPDPYKPVPGTNTVSWLSTDAVKETVSVLGLSIVRSRLPTVLAKSKVTSMRLRVFPLPTRNPKPLAPRWAIFCTESVNQYAAFQRADDFAIAAVIQHE